MIDAVDHYQPIITHMEFKTTGLLNSLDFVERARIEEELGELFEELRLAASDIKGLLRELTTTLDRLFYGDQKAQ